MADLRVYYPELNPHELQRVKDLLEAALDHIADPSEPVAMTKDPIEQMDLVSALHKIRKCSQVKQ